jgi:ribosome-binding protein aMBF1 (putative translation factor)
VNREEATKTTESQQDKGRIESQTKRNNRKKAADATQTKGRRTDYDYKWVLREARARRGESLGSMSSA